MPCDVKAMSSVRHAKELKINRFRVECTNPNQPGAECGAPWRPF